MALADKYRKAISTFFVTGCAYGVSFLINFLLTPFITNSVGAEAYGFVTLANNFIQYATIVAVALNSFAARHIAVSYHRAEYQKANTFYSSVFYGDLALASLILAVVFILVGSLDNLLAVPDDILADVKVLFMLTFIGFWVTTVFTVFSASALVKNKLDMAGIFKGISYITEAVVLIVCYTLFPAKIAFVGLGVIAAALIVALSNVWISRKFTPELRINKCYVSIGAVRRLIGDGVWTSANSLGNMLNSGLDLIVCNLFLSPLSMGQLAIGKNIESIFYGLYTLVNQAFQPMFIKSFSEGDIDKLLAELKLSMKMSGLVANVAFACFLALGYPFFSLWIPGQDIDAIYVLTVLTVALCIPNGPMQPLYYIYVLTVKRKIPCFVTLAGGILNVAGMLVLIKSTDLGVYSVPITTLVVMCIINFIFNPLYMAYVLKVPLKTFYPCIMKNLVSCGLLCIVAYLLSLCYSPSSWLMLAVCLLIYTAVGCAVHFLVVCDRAQRQVLVGAIASMLSK